MYQTIGSTDDDLRNERIPAKTLREMLARRLPMSPAATVSACAFVINRADGTITMVRTSTHRVLPPITIGEEPWGAAATPDGRFLYVSHAPSSSVSVLDVARRAIVATIAVGRSPQGIAVTPDGRRAYVANTDDDSISAIDTTTGTVIGHPIAAGHAPWTLAIAPDGRRAYVANASADSVTVIDLVTHARVTTIGVGKLPLAIAIAPDGRFAYVANAGANTVTAIDLVSNTAISVNPTSPVNAASPVNAESTANAASTADTEGGTSAAGAAGTADAAGAAISVGGFTCDLAVTPDGSLLCVVNANSQSVTLIDTAALAVINHIDVGGTPAGVDIAADGRHAYVTLATSHVMVAIDLAERRVVSPSIPVGDSPFGPAMGPPIVLPDSQQPAAAFTIEHDADLTARGFGRFVPFDGGALRLAGPWHTNRHLSLLTHGGWIDTNGFDAIVEGDVVSDGSLTKTGPGALTLCGAIEHRKDTFVLEGTLIVESRHGAPVFVDGGVLGGTGHVGTVSVKDGAISPGARRPGVLAADKVTLSARAALIIDINGPVCGTDYGRLDVKATATINDATLIARFGAALPAGTELTILTNAQGTFAGLPEGAVVTAAEEQQARITYIGGSGRDVVLTVL
jgi:YVTN family beta-propeller protein/autotransporter-associated beta strand protein